MKAAASATGWVAKTASPDIKEAPAAGALIAGVQVDKVNVERKQQIKQEDRAAAPAAALTGSYILHHLCYST